MSLAVSVVLPSHNPRGDFLDSVLEALRNQTLATSQWELIVVDNHSEQPLAGLLNLTWHLRATILREEQLGLTRARLAGFGRAQGNLIVLVDDDNILTPNYLADVLGIASKFPFLGTWSGQVELKLENPDHPPPQQLSHLLCERRIAAPVWSSDPQHIAATPWGAGMCVRREVMDAYIEATRTNPRRLQLDLQGKALAYGGDSDIAYVGCSMGFGMGVFPELKVIHLIPESRCTLDYLLGNLEAHAYSEVLHHWVAVGVIPRARSDLKGKLGNWVRWLLSDPLQRRIVETKERGLRKAREELAGQPTVAQ
jgi:glycosyltransferase involved in cell wall biosynthesis